jgi:hypothetical protein
MKSGTKGIPNDLKDKPMIPFNHFEQNSMVTRLGGLPGFGMLARELGTIFDVCEQKGDCATWFGGYYCLLLDMSIMT